MVRQYTKIHDQYLVDFLIHNFPEGQYIIYPRVGEIQSEYLEGLSADEKKAMSPWKLRPDAFAWKDGKFYIIEVIVRPNEWWKYAKLAEYELAFRRDPEYKEFHNMPVIKMLVSSESNEFAERQCALAGVVFVKYRPTWILPYIASLPKRIQRPYGHILE